MAALLRAVLAMARPSPRRALAVVLLAALGSLAVPATAKSTATLTVRGARGGYVEHTFRSPVTLHLSPSTTVTGGGSYAGYYLQPLSGQAKPDTGWGEVWFSTFRDDAFRTSNFAIPLGRSYYLEPKQFKARRFAVPAGRYRIHVFGDKPVTARLVLSGSVAPATLTARSSSRAWALARDLTTTVAGQRPAGPVATVSDVPVATTPTTLSVTATYTVETEVVTGLATHGACIGRPDGMRCIGEKTEPRPDWYLYRVYHPSTLPVTSIACMEVQYYYPGDLVPGENTAYYDIVSTNLTRHVATGLFTLTL